MQGCFELDESTNIFISLPFIEQGRKARTTHEEDKNNNSREEQWSGKGGSLER